MRNIAMGAMIVVALLWSTISQAAPKPLLVWVYGDGESGRFLSELKGLNDSTVTKITVKRKSPMESSGPTALGTRPVLASRLITDLTSVPALERPNLVHIGYNASADSWIYCVQSGSAERADSVWMPGVQQKAAAEATAINDAATWATALQLRVLLSKGPGAASPDAVAQLPLTAINAKDKIARRCMAYAFNLVTFFLASLNNSIYPWVDFSGFTVDSRLGGAPMTAWQLNPMTVLHWQQDGIHISTDKTKYDGQDPPFPLPPFTEGFTVGTPPPKVPQTTLGAYRVAKNVFRAYQSIQSQL